MEIWHPRIIDWLIWLTYVFLGYGLLYLYLNFTKNENRKYLIRGYFIKVAGGLAFVLVYVYYYGYGDTFRYYYDAITLGELFSSDPITYFKVLFTTFDNIEFTSPEVKRHISKCYFDFDPEGWFMARINSIFAILTSNSYLVATYLFSLMSFIGAYHFYKLCNLILDNKARLSYMISFLIPSTIFWGSGILKDNYTLFASSIFIYNLYKLFFTSDSKSMSILLLIVTGYLLFILKAYIIISLLPWFFITLYLFFSRKVNSQIIRLVTAPIILIIISISGYFLFKTVTTSSDKYNTEVLESRAKGFQGWHKSLGGSYYDLGQIEYTPIGILKVAPLALSATFFQPFPWEIRNFFMILNSLEGLFFLYILVYIFLSCRFKFLIYVYNSTFLFGGLIFCIIFGVAVGMNSYNYGALARYKLPVLLPFALILTYLKLKVDTIKAEKQLKLKK